MPPKPAVRASGKSKLKPKISLADRVRHEWAGFEVWLEGQRKQVDVQKEARVRALYQQIESKKRTLPKGFHPTLMKDFEDGKQKIAYEEAYELVHRSRDEWEQRLEKAGLKAEDWDPMTLAEQEAVRSALAGLSDDEDDFSTRENFDFVENPALHQFAASTNVQHTGSYLDVPTFSRLALDTERTKSLSPLPELLDCLRSQTPNRIPPTPPYTPGQTALFGETKPLGTRYTGPVLVEDNRNENSEDADFAKFKISIREQMIREFHEEAATLEITLVRKEHEAKLKTDAVKALLAAHELNMEELRRQKEDKRKALVEAERTKRQTEIRRRNFTPKSIQPEPNAWLENFSQPKGQGKVSKQAAYNNETHPVPVVTAERPSTPADVPASSNQSAMGKKETKKQKNAKSSKKSATSRIQHLNAETNLPPEKQLGRENPAEIDQPSEQKTRAKLRGILKDTSARIDMKPTVEEVSDAEADSRIEPRIEPKKQQGSGLPGMFTEPYRAPSTRPFGSDTDEDKPARFGRAADVSQSKKSKKSTQRSPSIQQIEITTEKFISSDADENQSYWDIINRGMGMEQQQGDVSESTTSASGGKHELWKPPVFDNDSAEEDEGSDLFQSLAFGEGMPDSLSSAAWAGDGLHHKNAPTSFQGLKEKTVTGQADSRYRNAFKGAPKMTSKEMSAQNSVGELNFDTDWQAAMMGKFYGFA